MTEADDPFVPWASSKTIIAFAKTLVADPAIHDALLDATRTGSLDAQTLNIIDTLIRSGKGADRVIWMQHNLYLSECVAMRVLAREFDGFDDPRVVEFLHARMHPQPHQPAEQSEGARRYPTYDELVDYAWYVRADKKLWTALLEVPRDAFLPDELRGAFNLTEQRFLRSRCLMNIVSLTMAVGALRAAIERHGAEAGPDDPEFEVDLRRSLETYKNIFPSKFRP
jgi:hypothetical protein